MPGFNANNSSKVKPFLSANCRPPSPLRTVSYIGWSDLEFVFVHENQSFVVVAVQIVQNLLSLIISFN